MNDKWGKMKEIELNRIELRKMKEQVLAIPSEESDMVCKDCML